MGTREVYEEKLRTGNLYHHDPTIKPGLGSPRCPRCLSLLNPSQDNSEWAITSVLHDATGVVGSGLGGLLSAVHGFNTGIPYIQKHVKGSKWLPFVIGNSSTAYVLCCKRYFWRLRASKICPSKCNIILCSLKCLTLWYFIGY